LSCFGLDQHDNDFVIGLIGADLYPLSACVQQMRKTRQTSQYIEAMGPFFVGKAFWQSPMTPKPFRG
jgi:chlorite dismutase